MIAFLVAFDDMYDEAFSALSVLTLGAEDDVSDWCWTLASACGAGVVLVLIIDWYTNFKICVFLLDAVVTLVPCIVLAVVLTCDH